jgi:hypothetical protein
LKIEENLHVPCLHSLYAQQKKAETTTNKTTKTFVKKSSLTKILLTNWEGLFHDNNLENNGAIVIGYTQL